MNADIVEQPNSRPLGLIFKEHLDNTIECGKALSELFLNLKEPSLHISNIKRLEEKGDKLTSDAYHCLELPAYSEVIYITEQLLRRLDDIVDGMNDTARLIDICQPRQIENAAHDLLSNLVSMVEKLQIVIAQYPDIELANIRACCKSLKGYEENADLIYHEWRKKQRRDLVLSLIEENNWTEILGVLEQTTDATYHTGLLLERIARFHQK
jgi:uncharacterized protein Yka (UPF0111/DUF47 family)